MLGAFSSELAAYRCAYAVCCNEVGEVLSDPPNTVEMLREEVKRLLEGPNKASLTGYTVPILEVIVKKIPLDQPGELALVTDEFPPEEGYCGIM